MTDRITETAYQKHAWKLLFAIGLIGLAGSLPPIFGVDLDPARKEAILGMTIGELNDSNPKFLTLITYLNRGYGLLNLAWAVLIISISATAFRAGEKWAWFALWSLPAFFIASSAILIRLGLTPVEVVLLPMLVILSILGLLLPYRKFFPST